MPTPEEIRRIARLARLELDDEQVSVYARQLDDVLHHVDRLAQLDTDAVAPMMHAAHDDDAFRDDEPTPSLPPESATANSESPSGPYLRVPRTVQG